MTSVVHVVIVTHNSSQFLQTCLDHLQEQTTPADTITIVDSGSENREYLEKIEKKAGLQIIFGENRGYSTANNSGFKLLKASAGMVIFMNPDTFLPPGYITLALEVLSEESTAAIVCGKLLGFNHENMSPTGKIDSTGIFRKWYGRWYDRGQGENDTGQYDYTCYVPAVCGALMCCNIKALNMFNGDVFDPDFFLYKEDIELSLRLKKNGWMLKYTPRLSAYHCRGWQTDRRSISQTMRVVAAESEMLLYKKHPSPYIIWAFLKLMAVKLLRM